jgi:hypothetical protein
VWLCLRRTHALDGEIPKEGSLGHRSLRDDGRADHLFATMVIVMVRKQIVVDAPIARGPSASLTRFDDFKPPEHNLLGSPIARPCSNPTSED